MNTEVTESAEFPSVVTKILNSFLISVFLNLNETEFPTESTEGVSGC